MVIDQVVGGPFRGREVRPSFHCPLLRCSDFEAAADDGFRAVDGVLVA
jgi:hypothetical protein